MTKVIHPDWLPFPKGNINNVPPGLWAFRTDNCGHPGIRILEVTPDRTSPGRILLWENGGGSRRWDPQWQGIEFTHYAPVSSLTNVVQELLPPPRPPTTYIQNENPRWPMPTPKTYLDFPLSAKAGGAADLIPSHTYTPDPFWPDSCAECGFWIGTRDMHFNYDPTTGTIREPHEVSAAPCSGDASCPYRQRGCGCPDVETHTVWPDPMGPSKWPEDSPLRKPYYAEGYGKYGG